MSVSASLVTSTGQPRVFHTPAGSVAWTPSLPVHRGDRLTVAFSSSPTLEPTRVWVSLDNRGLADFRKAPYRVLVDTSSLAPGRHVVKGDMRFAGSPRKYGISEYVFYVQQPTSEVKGFVEIYGVPPGGKLSEAPPVGGSFIPPAEEQIDPSFNVVLLSTDEDAYSAIQSGQPIDVRGPVVLYPKSGAGLDRWAYSITRDGRQVAGAGPISPMVRLEVAPKSSTEPGILPGSVVLTAWGVKSSGKYSRPIEVRLVIH